MDGEGLFLRVAGAAMAVAVMFVPLCLAQGSPAQSRQSGNRVLRIIAFGAHPDDNEIKAGGVAALWAAQGDPVKFVSCTNGDIGHWDMAGSPPRKN